MNGDFALGTELTEQDVGGDLYISARQTAAPGNAGRSLNAATNGGWGLVVGALALWAFWRLFPGNEPQQPTTPRPPFVAAAPAAPPSRTPKAEAISIEIGDRGIVIKHGPPTASTPAPGVGQSTHKAAPTAGTPTRSRAASAAAAGLPDR